MSADGVVVRFIKNSEDPAIVKLLEKAFLVMILFEIFCFLLTFLQQSFCYRLCKKSVLQVFGSMRKIVWN